MDESQLSALYRRLGPLLYSRCLAGAPDAEAAQAATRDAFVALVRALDLSRGDEAAIGWMDAWVPMRASGPLPAALADAPDAQEPARAGHLDRATVELLHLGALPLPRLAQAQGHLPGCERCQRECKALEQDAVRFAQYVFPRTLPGLGERIGAFRWDWRWLFPVAGLVLCAALVVVVVPRQPPVIAGARQGQALLELFTERAGRPLAVGRQTVLAAGDPLGFRVDPAGARFVLIASRDARGSFRVYVPLRGASSRELFAGRQDLPGTVELEEATGTEWIAAVFSTRSLTAAELEPLLAADARSREALLRLPGVTEVLLLPLRRGPRE